jgi:HlyD family secretion protein
MRRWRKRLLWVGIPVVVIVVLRLTLFAPKPVPVTVYHVDQGRVEDTVVNSRAGTVESRLRAKMSPAIAGLVTAIPAKKGQRVKKGETLLRLDDDEARAQVNLAARSVDASEAAANEACLKADQAARDYKRSQGLANQDLLSADALEKSQTVSESAAAACTAARESAKKAHASLDAARAVLDKTVMKAPFDGVVLDVTTEVGEWISPAPPGVFIPPVIDVIAPAALYVSAPIDEADVAKLHLGLPVRITMDAFRGRSFPGTLTYTASYVETKQEQNRTLTVEAEFDSTDLPANLLPGLSADLEIILDAQDNALRIPTYAVLEGNRVLVVEKDKLVSRQVTTGLRNWEFTQITGGLSEGDAVVVSLDRPEVKAGAKVTVTEQTKPGEMAGTP